MLNGAVADVLGEKRWKHDIRHDGSFNTVPTTDFTGGIVAGNAKTLLSDDLAAYVHPDVASAAYYYTGPIISRFEYTGDASLTTEGRLEGAVFRVESILETAGFAQLTMDNFWPGAGSFGAKGTMMVAEYLLPETVKAVTSVRCQGVPITLDQIDPGASWDEAIPRMSDSYGDPLWCGVGGYDYNTYESTKTGDIYSQTEPRLRMILYPVPDTRIPIDYTYYYQHPQLTAKDDVLAGVPDDLIADIIRFAHADVIQTLEREVRDGIRVENSARGSTDRKYASHDPQPAGRHIVKSWNGSGSRFDVERGFPGKTIEGPS